MSDTHPIEVGRVYDPVGWHKGARLLVDRLWPRGMKKESLPLDAWTKAVAPSNDLRKWFGHDPARWDEFQTRYRAELDGNPEAIWTDGDPSGAEVLKRLKKLPGFGDQKAKIFLSLLGKQFELQAEGWQEAAGDYGDPEARRSIADVVDDVTLQEVRAFKKQQKAAAKAANK